MEHQDLLTPMFNSHILSSVPGRSQFTFAAANAVSDFETTVLYNDNVLYGLLQERVEYQDLFIPKLRIGLASEVYSMFENCMHEGNLLFPGFS
nr:hypothetical protein CFP56_59388 [Quercus suber]